MVNGIFILDKALGVSSNRALQQVRRLFGAQKAGHTGSLDPLASGVLPICFGEATKISQYFLDDNKCYRFELKFGVTTTTGDAEGEIVSTSVVPEFQQEQLEALCAKLRCTIKQTPPIYSAIHVDGRRLYEYAREGKEVAIPERTVTIYELKVESFTKDTAVFVVSCSKGTYVRSLGESIGNGLGCGAHVVMLDRTKAGMFVRDNATLFSRLEQVANAENAFDELDSFLVTIEDAVAAWDRVNVSGSDVAKVKNGIRLNIHDAQPSECAAIFDDEGKCIGIGKVTTELELQPKRIFHTV